MMTHTNCSGCPACDPEMRAALRAFSAGDNQTYCRWLTVQNDKLRTAGARGELRTSIHFQEDVTMESDYTPIDPYAADIAKLRAAEATPESRFVDRYTDMRTRKLAEERTEIDAHIQAYPFPRLTAAEAAEYDSPDPWADGIRKLREGTR